MKHNVPGIGIGELELHTIILDLNGTLSVGGEIVKGVIERLHKLKELGYKILFFTGNTRGNADELARQLSIDWVLAEDGEAKKEQALKLKPETCVSIGNGLIDLEMMKVVKLRIVTLQAEGVHVKTLLNSDVIVPNINDALDLLLDPSRLIATLRK
jgi:soluble P-type ATPase